MWFVECLGGLKIAAVDFERAVQMVRRKMRGKGVGHAELCCQLRAKQAGAQHPELDIGAKAGGRLDRKIDIAGQQSAQFEHILREVFGRLVQVLAKRPLKLWSSARSAA